MLSPSTCYHTFAALENKTLNEDLVFYTAKGECHRYEPEQDAPGRLVNFTMREFILLGTPDEVMQSCDRIFERVLSFLNRVDNSFYQETANDVFYGGNSVITQKVQRVLGVKKEIVSCSELGPAVSVGSRNYHRELFTMKFNIRTARLNTELHSSCVAFGIERLLLTLLSKTAGYKPHRLITQLYRAMPDGLQEYL
ncbi:aminoacyl--tRNA ligase-related protein [Photorhabdus luminescens]|uniref:aminoacyl--tRNA ligase-related protein n=1 Tax=Photorhabdus luminescens TaxID=29488 RepID=UPI00223F37A2|nr:hypothetical protein [Photorhabdus luminescens subsp. venezuelensis]